MCNAFGTILKILKKTLTQIPAETDEKRKKETYYSKLIDIPIGKLFHNSHTNTQTHGIGRAILHFCVCELFVVRLPFIIISLVCNMH